MLYLLVIFALHLPSLRRDALELAFEIPRGVAAEFAVDAEMRRLVERRAAHAAMAEMEEIGAGETHQQRRVRGDDVLRVAARPVLVEHRHEFELALRRQSRLGLVEEIDAALLAAEPGVEEREEGLAVAARMQAARAPGRDLVVLLIGPLDIGDEVEEALGAEEEAVRHLGQPGERERGGKAALVARAAIVIVAAAAAAVEAGLARDRFQQARLSRTVLANEKGYR